MSQALTIALQLVCSIAPFNSGYCNATYVASEPISIQPTVLPNGYTAFPDLGVACKYYSQLRTWNSARISCMANGSNMVIVDSFKKYNRIKAMINLPNGSVSPHVGIHRLFDDIEWVSLETDLPPVAIPWAPKTWVENPVKKCLAMRADGSGVGADFCTRLRPYVCEIPLLME